MNPIAILAALEKIMSAISTVVTIINTVKELTSVAKEVVEKLKKIRDMIHGVKSATWSMSILETEDMVIPTGTFNRGDALAYMLAKLIYQLGVALGPDWAKLILNNLSPQVREGVLSHMSVFPTEATDIRELLEFLTDIINRHRGEKDYKILSKWLIVASGVAADRSNMWGASLQNALDKILVFLNSPPEQTITVLDKSDIRDFCLNPDVFIQKQIKYLPTIATTADGKVADKSWWETASDWIGTMSNYFSPANAATDALKNFWSSQSHDVLGNENMRLVELRSLDNILDLKECNVIPIDAESDLVYFAYRDFVRRLQRR